MHINARIYACMFRKIERTESIKAEIVPRKIEVIGINYP